MRNLLWKEWHEQAWKLTFGCVVLSALALIGLRARMVPDATMVDWVCIVGTMILPVLASTGLVPAERAEGTLEALVALPVAPRQILAAKAMLGVLLVVGPIVVAGAISVAMAGGREVYTSAMVWQYVGATLTGIAMFAWMTALTVRLPSEARAALIAMGVLIIWLLISAGLGDSHARWATFAATPFAFVYQIPDPLPGQVTLGPGPRPWLVFAVQLPLTAAAGWLALRSFTRSTEDAQ